MAAAKSAAAHERWKGSGVVATRRRQSPVPAL